MGFYIVTFGGTLLAVVLCYILKHQTEQYKNGN